MSSLYILVMKKLDFREIELVAKVTANVGGWELRCYFPFIFLCFSIFTNHNI